MYATCTVCTRGTTLFAGCLSTRYQHHTSVTLSTEDATQLRSCDVGGFAVAIDKGLTDALLCSAQGLNAVRKMLAGVHAALQGGGCLLMVTKATPAQIDSILQQSDDPIAAAGGGGGDSALHTPAAVAEQPVSAGEWQVASVPIGGEQGSPSAVFLHTLQRPQ